MSAAMTDLKQPWADDDEHLWNVVIEDWGQTPGQVTLVLRTYSGMPIQTIRAWRSSSDPTVATGGQRTMQRFLRDLEVAGARYRLKPAEEERR